VVTVEEALRTLADQSESRRLRDIVSRTHAGVIEGLRLSDAMGRLGPAFPVT
jgi:type II secretory pathway component PulF